MIVVCEVVFDGSVQVFIGFGGNFVCVIFDYGVIELVWGVFDLIVYIVIKFNCLYLILGKSCYLFFCFGRIEFDMQVSGVQSVLVEDLFSCIFGFKGKVMFVVDMLLLEFVIFVGIVKVMFLFNFKFDWDVWVGDYVKICDVIEEIYFDLFVNFNEWMFMFGGFWKGVFVVYCEWKIVSGCVEINVFQVLNVIGFDEVEGCFWLMMFRLNDQFNIMIYGYYDCFCGVNGMWDIVFMNCVDMDWMGIVDVDMVYLVGDVGGNVEWWVDNLCVVEYLVLLGCIGVYYFECNVLILVVYYVCESYVFVVKFVLVWIEKVVF